VWGLGTGAFAYTIFQFSIDQLELSTSGDKNQVCEQNQLPWDSGKVRPVEAMSDWLWHATALSDETGKPTRECGKPQALTMGRCHNRIEKTRK
jgi:hypothetical protein